MKKIIFTITCTFLLFNCVAQPGALDTTFGTGGKIALLQGGSLSSVSCQADGKIIILGTINNGFYLKCGVFRFNKNGTPDNTFGTGGLVTTNFGIGHSYGLSGAIQYDGKIVAAGYHYTVSTGVDFALARYNTNGSLDNTFGSGGIVITDINNSEDKAFSVAIQSDGKIVVGGETKIGSYYDFAVLRYNTNGILDTTFGAKGKVTTTFGNYDYGNSVAIQSDGKIILSGSCYDFNYGYNFGMVRYNPNGTVDKKVAISVGISNDYSQSVAIQGDGKILLAGSTRIGMYSDIALVRYNTDCTIDNSFGTGGVVITDISNMNDDANSVAIQGDGKILVGGLSEKTGNTDFAVLRYNSDGTLDNTFGSGGEVTTDFGNNDDKVNALTIQNDGKILVVGGSGSSTTFEIARYLKCSNSNSSETVSSCKSYTWGNKTITTSGIYKDTIPNSLGCDSLMVLDVTINKVDTSISINGKVLTSNASAATHQWINCNTHQAIAGAVNKSYTATQTGNYAVRVIQNTCTDTSGCYTIDFAGITQNTFGSVFFFSPNPTKGNVLIDLGFEYNKIHIVVKNALGQTVANYNYSKSNKAIFDIPGASGIYIIELTTPEGEMARVKIIKE